MKTTSLLILLLLTQSYAAIVRQNAAASFMDGAFSSVSVISGKKPQIQAQSNVKGDKRRYSSGGSAAAGSQTSHAELQMSARQQTTLEQDEIVVKSAIRAIIDNELTENQVMEARTHLRTYQYRPESQLVLVGEPPEPLTLAERWRDVGAKPTERCFGLCCVRSVTTGYVCIDDYEARAIICNPRLAFRPDASACAVHAEAPYVDHADTIVRRFDEKANNLPSSGQTDVYFALSFPVVPRNSPL